MIEIWTARKKLWSPESSGFDSITEMADWLRAFQEQHPESARPMLCPSEGSETIDFIHSKLENKEFLTIPNLSPKTRKRVRFEYHAWLTMMKELLGNVSSDDMLISTLRLTSIEESSVKLFGCEVNSEEVEWCLVWGVNLDNAKENFLPDYATLASPKQTPELIEDNLETASTDFDSSSPARPPMRQQSASRDVSFQGVDSKGKDGPFHSWFISNRVLLTAFATLLFLIGLIHTLIIST